MRRSVIQYLLGRIVRQPNFSDLKLGDPQNTAIDNETVGTLMRRILVLLSRRNQPTSNESFVKLHELVQLSFTTAKDLNPDLDHASHFKPLADVLCALNQPSYEKTFTSPWIIIRYNENVLADSNTLAKALEDAWKDYRANEYSCNKYPVDRYGVRITKSGHLFVSTVHPDFSFFAALYCNEEAPLMLLKDVNAVKTQINRVCSKAKEYVKKLNEIDNNFFQNLEARKSSYSANAVEREHLFLRRPMTEVSLQELIVYRIHMFLVHYQRFLGRHGTEVFGNGNSQLLTHVKQQIKFLGTEFTALKSANQVVSTAELFSFERLYRS
jgi:hypothetical protein